MVTLYYIANLLSGLPGVHGYLDETRSLEPLIMQRYDVNIYERLSVGLL